MSKRRNKKLVRIWKIQVAEDYMRVGLQMWMCFVDQDDELWQ